MLAGEGGGRGAPGRALARLAGVVPVVLAVATLGVAAVQVGAANLHEDEQERLRSRADLVATTAEGQADIQRGAVLDNLSRTLPFQPDNPALNQLLVDAVATQGAFDSSALVVLYDRERRPMATAPAGSVLDPHVLGSTADGAFAGRVGVSPSFVYRGEVATASVVPVRAGDSVWGILAVVAATRASSTQDLLADLGALDGHPGGLSVVDPGGVVVQSWDAGRIGTVALAPAEVAGLPLNAAVRWTTGEGDGATTWLGRRLPSGYAVVFAERSADLFDDLRVAQRQRDVTMLAVLALLMLALAGAQLARQRAARRDGERVRLLLERGQDLIVVADHRGTVSFVSPSVGRLLGHRPAGWVTRPLPDRAHPDDRARLAALLAEPGTGPLHDVRLARSDGTYRWFDLEAEDHSGHRDIGGVLLTCAGVDERKQLEDELAHQATHDRLTGLANRVALAARLDELIAGGRPRRSFALLYLDLDLFKPINDALGHAAGDRVLTTIAERIRQAAGAGALACRFGGDEFGILVPGAEREEAEGVAQALLAAVRRPLPFEGELLQVDVSIGVALASPEVAIGDGELLIREADKAMYDAKQAGRGRHLVVTPQVDGATAAPLPGRDGGAHPAAAVDGLPALLDGGAADGGRPSLLDRAALDGHPGPAAGSGSPPAPAGDPGPGAPARRNAGDGWEHGGLRARVGGLVPLGLAVAVVVIVAGTGLWQSVGSRRTAETRRLDDAVARTARIAELNSRVIDPQARIAGVSGLSWALDGGPGDRLLVERFQRSPSVGADALLALARPDGELLAIAPAGRPAPVGPDSPAWAVARSGRTGVVPSLTIDGVNRSYLLIPIVRGDRPAAVLTVGVTSVAEVDAALGRPGPVGDHALVGADGVAFSAWNTALVGRRLADRADLAGVGPSGRAIPGGDGDVVIAAPVASWSETEPVYVVYIAPAAGFYGDLRSGQLERDGLLVGVVIVAIAGLGAVHGRRVRDERRRERRLDALLQGAHDLITVVDGADRMTFVSSAATALLGADARDVRDRPLTGLVHEEDRATVSSLLAAARTSGGGAARDVRLRHRDGLERWFDVEANGLAEHGGGGRVLLTCHEVTRRRAIAERLAHQASHDVLTGLPNRASFTAGLEEITGDEAPFAVLFVDLDHFKPVNDTFGHDTGDAVLRAVAGRLQHHIRTWGRDRGGDGDLICRLGGDEFAVVLRDVTVDDATAVAERIIETIGEPIPVAGATVRVGATIGIAVSQRDEDHPSHTVRNADAAMYRAKRAGRGRYDVFVS